MTRDPHTQTMLARARLISQLRRCDEPGAETLAAVLTACAPNASCQSAACPVCGLAFQQAAVSLTNEFIRGPARAIRNRRTAITIVPDFGCIPPDAISVEDFENVGSEVKAAFADLNLPPTIIGVEASFDEDATGRFEEHWCVHTHSTQLDWLSVSQQRALKDRFPPSRLVRRPIRCEPLDSRHEWDPYPHKPERFRRVTSLKTDHPTRAPFRETEKRALRPWQAVRLALVEHELGFDRRFLTHGFDQNVVRRRLEGFGWAWGDP